MKKYAKIYREAAQIVERGESGDGYARYSCLAILTALGKETEDYLIVPQCVAYTSLYGGRAADLQSAIIVAKQQDAVPQRDMRVLLLCMAAAVAEAGDL